MSPLYERQTFTAPPKTLVSHELVALKTVEKKSIRVENGAGELTAWTGRDWLHSSGGALKAVKRRWDVRYRYEVCSDRRRR